MALKVAIQKSKEVSLWKEYKDIDGNVLAEFKIRGDGYKPFRVAIERAQNQVASKGYNVALAGSEDKLYPELLLEAAACHLIADWKGVVFVEDGKEIEPPYTLENATKLLNMGDIGWAIWMFIKVNAEKIQADSDAIQAETVGKSSISTNGTQETEG
ncbi:hypothetical protein [Acinetobacter entericus]|uniref:Tail assembly chaperone n=1 Tax=Acinetobacter entericus TaxID=2989714 RepID=A0ABT3NN99_9GAMM|nr:hypothetical protein [Acinetobacter entericus]MCW8041023.1 hypothetical protein [Acinetobacter entericus]